MVFRFSCALSLFFFSSFVPFSVFSFSPSLVTEMDEDNGTAASAHSRWSLLLGTVKTMATPVDDLCSFSFLLLMLSVEMMRETAMKTCYAWLSSRPCLCVFLLLTVAFCFLFSFVPLLFFFFSLLFRVLFLSLFFVLLLSFFSVTSFL